MMDYAKDAVMKFFMEVHHNSIITRNNLELSLFFNLWIGLADWCDYVTRVT